MKTGPMETLESRSVPAPEVITLQQRAIRDDDRAAGGEACAQTRFWAQPSNYLWATGAVGVGLGLHFYYVRETLVSLALFGLLFFSLSFVVLIVLGIGYAGNRAGIWAGPASRAVTALFMQRDRGETELAPALVVEDIGRGSDQQSEV
jgi:hypothetical protein